ncbi:hypothetical protein TNCV_4807711 [Trichonephila clavipes]|nr:hypothetical protein TNCV_4807711 [Trichonephila clavipes]
MRHEGILDIRRHKLSFEVGGRGREFKQNPFLADLYSRKKEVFTNFKSPKTSSQPTLESISTKPGGRGSLVAKVTDSWAACCEFEPSAAEDPPCRKRCTLHLLGAQASPGWRCVVVRRGGTSSGFILVT